jgi:hypothetical protein
MDQLHDVPFIDFLMRVYGYGFLFYIIACLGMYFKANICKENEPSDYLLGLLLAPLWFVVAFFLLFGRR